MYFWEVYVIYYDIIGDLDYVGIFCKFNFNDLLFSSILKGVEIFGYFYFNKDGYVIYCKDYKVYWNWVEECNEVCY